MLGDPNQAIFFACIGIAFSLVFANFGSAYGTAKSGVGIVSVCVIKSDILFKSIIPVVMAGVLGMYGMIIAILMKQASKFYSMLDPLHLAPLHGSQVVKTINDHHFLPLLIANPSFLFHLAAVIDTPLDAASLAKPEAWGYSLNQGYRTLGAGLCCGFSNLAAGLCIGVVGDAGVRGNGQRDILIALILMMIFAEALALYGFIVAIVLSNG